MKPFLWLLSLLSLGTMITSYIFLSIKVVNAQISNKYELISSAKKFMLKVSLQAKEEKLSPLGIPAQPNRDIGFATVFLKLENHQETNQTITIQKIEIRNIADKKLQKFNFQPRKIELKPLENSVIDIHLTNKTGYVGKDKVKAIVTYKIGKQVNVISSDAVTIERH